MAVQQMNLPPELSGDALVEPEPRVLLVEDDAAVVASLELVFARYGIRSALAGSVAAAKELKASFAPTVVVVDLSLPDGNGMELVKWLANNGDCGIIVLTGNPDETDRIVGLEVGADDYIAKPPSNRELIARIRAVHRRVLASVQPAPAEPAPRADIRTTITIDPVRIDLQQRRALDARGRRIPFTAAEFAIIEALAAARGDVVSQERLSELALRRPLRVEDRSISQLIFSLRRKLAEAGADEQVIQTVRAAGYALRIPDPG